MKLVKEDINFERGQEPKKAMNVGLDTMTTKELVEKSLLALFDQYIQYNNYDGLGQWLATEMKELFTGATYGDYPVENAQEDFNEFLSGWNRISKKIDEIS